MVFYNHYKIGAFWNKDLLLEENKEVGVARKIIYLKEKCLNKLETGEWTKDEYEKFTMAVRRMNVGRFIGFYDLAILYLELTNEECREEIEYLNNSGVINLNNKSGNFYGLMVDSIGELSAKIVSLSKLAISSEEKDIFVRFDEKREVYESILTQLNDPNSDYTNMIKETFACFVNKSVNNDSLKEKVLAMESVFVESQKKYIRTYLNEVIRQFENNKKPCYNNGNYDYGTKCMEYMKKRGN